MSLHLLLFTPTETTIVTDTLATTPTGEPFLYVSKLRVLPHLRMTVSHTGAAAIGQRWGQIADSHLRAIDIEMVNLHAPSALRGIADDLLAEFGDTAGTTTSTVFHVGCPDAETELVGYAYKSENDFEPETIEPGLRCRPAPIDVQFDDPFDIIEFAKALRLEQSGVPLSERTHIGGELVVTQVTAQAIVSFTAHRFDDFFDQWEAMNA